MKTEGSCWPKALLLEGMNGHREQGINSEGASTKTKYQLKQRKTLTRAPFHVGVNKLRYRWENQWK